MQYNICELLTSLVTPLSGVILSNILSCELGAIWITCANIKLIIYPIYMSLDVNITKNYSPKGTQWNVTNFNFINSPQLPLLIEHCQNLARYQFFDLINFYHVHSNAPILKYLSNIQHLLLDAVEKKKTQKATMRMLKLRTSFPMEWNTLLWRGT